MREQPARADLWLAQESPDPEMLVVGIPWAREWEGMAMAPLALRDRLHRFGTFHVERETDISDVTVTDLGNWPVDRMEPAELGRYLAQRCADLPPARLMVFVGGDDSITSSVLPALDGRKTSGLIRFSNRTLEDAEPLVGVDTVYVGAHSFAAGAPSPSDDRSHTTVISIAQVEKAGATVTVDRALGILSMCDAIHVSVDVDTLDQAIAPGSATSLPGGMTVRQLGEAVHRCGASAHVSSMDFVGADVDSDISNLTIDAMCHLFLSAVTGYAERTERI